MIVQEKVTEEWVKWVANRPITFEEFVDLPAQERCVELIDGAVVEKMAIQLEHEKLLIWLITLFNQYAEERDLGIVLGSRTPVPINEFRGRMPNLLFVRRDRLAIVQQKAVYGAPDLVIEIISPNDRPSDILGLETDYRSIGVPEIVLINQSKRRVRLLHKRGEDYDRTEIKSGTLTLESLESLQLQVQWLFAEPRPTVRATLARVLMKEETT